MRQAQKNADRALRRKERRQQYLDSVELRYDADVDWDRGLLVEQTEAREVKSCQNMNKKALLQKIAEVDKARDLAFLKAAAVSRNVDVANTRSTKKLLKILLKHDDDREYPDSMKPSKEDSSEDEEQEEAGELVGYDEDEDEEDDEGSPESTSFDIHGFHGGGCKQVHKHRPNQNGSVLWRYLVQNNHEYSCKRFVVDQQKEKKKEKGGREEAVITYSQMCSNSTCSISSLALVALR